MRGKTKECGMKPCRGSAVVVWLVAAGILCRVGAELSTVLIFSRCDRYEHTASKNNFIAFVEELGDELGFDVVAGENAEEVLTDRALEEFDLTIWNNNCWLDLDTEYEEAFREYMESGGNYVGVHCACALHGLWPWYSDTLLNADFLDHASVEEGRAYVEQKNRDHPILENVPDEFLISEEWYTFEPDPSDNPDNIVLVLVDEDTYQGAKMGGYHPMAWARELDGGGKMFFTAFGHDPALYNDPGPFRTLVRNAIRWSGEGIVRTPSVQPPRAGAVTSPMPGIGSREVYDVLGHQLGAVHQGTVVHGRSLPAGVYILKTVDRSGHVARRAHLSTGQ